jgi:hypothetical protein
MIKFNHRRFMPGLMATTALVLGLLAGGAVPAFAGTVSITGANVANVVPPGQAGGAGGFATATEQTTDPSNFATATGSNGGVGGAYTVFSCLQYNFQGPCSYGGKGGAGGPAIATAATTISGTGAALAEATSTGGIGGRGGFGTRRGGTGGTGGNAILSAAASAGSGSASATATSTGGAGGAGGGTFSSGIKGAGGTRGTASARSDAKNASGEALATAFAPGGVVSAVSSFAVGSGPEGQAAIVAGRIVSDAKRTRGGSVIGYGAMSAGSGESGAATALFDFSTTVPEALDLNLLSDSFLGSSDTGELMVVVGAKSITYEFSNLPSRSSSRSARLPLETKLSQSVSTSKAGAASASPMTSRTREPPAPFPNRRPGRCCSSASPASPTPATGPRGTRGRQVNVT